MYKIFKNLLLAVMVLCSVAAMAQVGSTSHMVTVTGTIFSADQGTPLANIQVTSRDAITGTVTDAEGKFEIELRDPYALLNVSAKGYFTQAVELMGRSNVKVFLQAEDAVLTTDSYTTFGGSHYITEKTTATTAINNKDFGESFTTVDNALSGRMAGLNVISKGGQVGEGSYISSRGIRSMFGNNVPLIVVDGIPYTANYDESSVIEGYSSNIFEVVNTKEIESVSFLKGADALAYGSMGSNGVLSIVTEQGVDQETQVEVSSINGVSFVKNTLPVMDAFSYRNYVADIGSRAYPDAADFIKKFPFLYEQDKGIAQYKYVYDTDWQDLIYKPAFSSDNTLKVKGGDAAVKFMLSIGYQKANGVVDGTSQSKITTRGNANIVFTPKLSAYASIAFNYNDFRLSEQGMTAETNPTLAAYDQMPLLDVYQRNINGKLTNSFSEVESLLGSSNPVAMLSGIKTSVRNYDMLINTGINYNANRYLDFELRFGINYSYLKDDIFIGGRTTKAIAPLEGGVALNTVRSGSAERKSYYVRGNMGYDRTFGGLHNVDIDASYQLMTNDSRSTVGKGINTSNDKYTSLNNTVVAMGRESWGAIDIHNWMNGYVSGSYTYNSQLYASAAVLANAASTYGAYSNRLYFYPSANVGWRLKNTNAFIDNDAISNFTVRGDYSILPNSQFDMRYGRYYYELDMLFNISGVVRANLPNQDIAPEEVHSANLGVDLALAKNRLAFNLDLYQEDTRNMIVDNAISPIYGFNKIYDNVGRIQTRGIELGFNTSIINQPKVQWIVSGTVSTYATKLLSLGNVNSQINAIYDDVTVINEVGRAPYEFYGLISDGVFSTTAEAEAANVRTVGGYYYGAGDVQYRDVNQDGVIGEADKTYLGSAAPDLFGGIQTRFKYGSFSLFANFKYSLGNKAYNGVRRYNESGSDYTNQSVTMERRWMSEGDVTDIPQVTYGDPLGNNAFSSRWIEDASYVKLKELTLNYSHNRKLLFFNSVDIFVTAENLLTFTKYTGLDPEFSYSYDTDMLGMDLAKVMLPTTVKLGLVLNF